MCFLLFINIFIIVLIVNIIHKCSKASIVCIISIAINYKPTLINVFINSLNRTNFTGKLVLFSNINYKANNSLLYELLIIKITTNWPFIERNSKLFDNKNNCILPKNIKKYKWAIHRYALYYCFMKKYYTYFNNIFLLDLRDTIFQLNPQNIVIKDAIYLCEDAGYPFTFNDDKWNKKWLLPFYSISNEVFKKVPLNGGSIYGKSLIMLQFLKQLYINLKKYYDITSDQGVVNWMYYNNRMKNIKTVINYNRNGSIYTMGIELTFKHIFPNNIYIIENSIVHRIDKSIPYILHQYDRDKSLKHLIFEKYS